MPETAILNPSPGWDPALGDSMNPSYGFTRKRATTQLHKKAVGGTPWTRETANTGHSFSLSWLGRTWPCVRRLKQYYEQYEDGFFTIIDWDGGGRHYVGRFTSEIAPVETSNNKWDVQNAAFEEMPRVPMVEYPGDWGNDSIVFHVTNDFGDQKLAVQGAWTLNPRSLLGRTLTTMDGAGVANDWAQFEYRGYGLQLFLMKGPEFGYCNVLLDGAVVAGLDCYAAADVGPQMVYQAQNVQLDIHRIQVTELGTKNPLATSTAISWAWLRVMR